MASKHKRNEKKCQAYRAKVGKPRGPSVAGNKSGKGFVPVSRATGAAPKKATASKKKK